MIYLVAIFFFFHSGERGHVAVLPTLKAKWFATLTLNNGNNDKQCCVNVFPDRWKDTLRVGRESCGHTVQSIAARSIVHKFLSRSPAWTKPERVLFNTYSSSPNGLWVNISCMRPKAELAIGSEAMRATGIIVLVKSNQLIKNIENKKF